MKAFILASFLLISFISNSAFAEDSAPELTISQNQGFNKLQKMSKKAEEYKSKLGHYPTSAQDFRVNELWSSTDAGCERTTPSWGGFIFTCEFSEDNYTFTATPADVNVSGTTIFIVKTGGKVEQKIIDKSQVVPGSAPSPASEIFKNESTAESSLIALSQAAEFFYDNEKRYPTNNTELKAYYGIEGLDCGPTRYGYIISCELSAEGYKLTATPEVPEVTGSKILTKENASRAEAKPKPDYLYYILGALLVVGIIFWKLRKKKPTPA